MRHQRLAMGWTAFAFAAALGSSYGSTAAAQTCGNNVSNGAFASSCTGWGADCEVTGGAAEIDFEGANDHKLSQTITGLVAGQQYALSFKFGRYSGGCAGIQIPETATVTVALSGTTFSTIELTRTGTALGTYNYTVTANATSATFTVVPGPELDEPGAVTLGIGCYGVVDDVSLTVSCADDGNPCTDQACSAGTCSTTNNTASCTDSDGNACTSGQCSGGSCSPVNNTASCEDGDACTVGDACSGGSCASGSAVNASDGLACTADACDSETGVSHTILAGWCVIGGVCAASGAANPANTCLACNPASSTTAWTNAGGKTDGSECTANGSAGTCGGSAATLQCCTNCWEGSTCRAGNTAAKCGRGGIECVACDDDNTCTTDRCQMRQCTYASEPTTTKCDADGNRCTGTTGTTPVNDNCNGLGACVAGPAVSCNDSKSCTVDSCSPSTGCANDIQAGCLISNACYSDGTTNPANGCQVCDAAATETAWSYKAAGAACSASGQVGLCRGVTSVTSCCTGCWTGTACANGDQVGACGDDGATCNACADTDELACTSAACVGNACGHAVSAGSCLIDGTCRSETELHPDDACQQCDTSKSATSWSPVFGDECGRPPDAGDREAGVDPEDGSDGEAGTPTSEPPPDGAVVPKDASPSDASAPDAMINPVKPKKKSGGGCAVGHADVGPAPLVVAAVLGLAWRRRRRR